MKVGRVLLRALNLAPSHIHPLQRSAAVSETHISPSNLLRTAT